MPSITKSGQAKPVIPLYVVTRSTNGNSRDLQRLAFTATFGKEGKELRSTPFYSASARSIDSPKFFGAVAELDRRIELCDTPIMGFLSEIRITHPGTATQRANQD